MVPRREEQLVAVGGLRILGEGGRVGVRVLLGAGKGRMSLWAGRGRREWCLCRWDRGRGKGGRMMRRGIRG